MSTSKIKQIVSLIISLGAIAIVVSAAGRVICKQDNNDLNKGLDEKFIKQCAKMKDSKIEDFYSDCHDPVKKKQLKAEVRELADLVLQAEKAGIDDFMFAFVSFFGQHFFHYEPLIVQKSIDTFTHRLFKLTYDRNKEWQLASSNEMNANVTVLEDKDFGMLIRDGFFSKLPLDNADGFICYRKGVLVIIDFEKHTAFWFYPDRIKAAIEDGDKEDTTGLRIK